MLCSGPLVPLLYGWVQVADDHVLTFGNVMPAFWVRYAGSCSRHRVLDLLHTHDEMHQAYARPTSRRWEPGRSFSQCLTNCFIQPGGLP